MTVSNDKALVVLDKDLQEIFRNEELMGSTDLCFFTCAAIKRSRSGHLDGKFWLEAVWRRVRFFSGLGRFWEIVD